MVGAARPARAQWVAQRYMPTEAERQELTAGLAELRKSLAALQEQAARTGKPRADQIPDAEIYVDAVDRNLRQNLFFQPRYVELARACLKEGAARIAALRDGKAPWERQNGLVVFGYRSAVDGSAQPYVLRVPAKYDFDHARAGRLDIHLHGRMGVMNELGYLNFVGWDGASNRDEETPFLVLHPYGRANNGWHFAGETDVFEALADTHRRFRVDPERIVMRGFSMGGHGAWHMGLQHPGLWSAMSPGAGFVEMKHFQRMKEPLPAWEEPLLHLYDALDYAANAKNLPLLAYTGDQDPAIEQHRLMVAALKREGAPFTEYVGPQTQHRYEPKTRATLMVDLAKFRREPEAASVDFVTYTLRFPECKWVRIEGLEQHWQRAEVHAHDGGADGVVVNTQNVSSLALTLPRSGGADSGRLVHLTVDGGPFAGPGFPCGKTVRLRKERGTWLLGESRGLRKRPGLQGPMDDALFGPVVAVSGTGKPWSEGMERWTTLELQRFREGWDEFFRATLPERTDGTLTKADIRRKNLYLFGDPGSNAVLRRLLPKLPVRWSADTFAFGAQSFSTRDHLPMLVFPNPESPGHYVVINSGFTFGRADWQGSNALQYPHLPDWAAVRYDPEHFADDRRKDTVAAGFFDEQWKLPKLR